MDSNKEFSDFIRYAMNKLNETYKDFHPWFINYQSNQSNENKEYDEKKKIS